MNHDKPKILFVMHLPPPVHGAAVVGDIIRRSARINSRFDCRYFNLATARSLEDIGKFRFAKIKDVFARIKAVCAEADAFRPDLVYITPTSCGMPFYKDYLMARALRKRGYKIVYHYHNKGVATRSERWLDNLLYRKFFSGAKVILLSRRLYSDVSCYVAPDDVLVCPNGIAAEPYDRSTAAPHDGPMRLLFLSNLFASKGVLTLLDAAVLLRQRGTAFRLTVAGAPTEEISADAIREHIASRGLTGTAEYIGTVHGAEKEKALREADIFVFPTRYANEAFPLVLLEAMAHSLPCVTTDEGGIPDIVADGKSGMIMTEASSEKLADALTALIADPKLRLSMGAEGLHCYNTLFTLPQFEESLITALKKCI